MADKLANLVLAYPARAGETGKLYGSITTQMIADSIQAKTGVTVDRRQVDVQPIRTLGEHKVHIRLTMDLVPEIRVIVHREGEMPNLGEPVVAAAAEAEPKRRSRRLQKDKACRKAGGINLAPQSIHSSPVQGRGSLSMRGNPAPFPATGVRSHE